MLDFYKYKVIHIYDIQSRSIIPSPFRGWLFFYRIVNPPNSAFMKPIDLLLKPGNIQSKVKHFCKKKIKFNEKKCQSLIDYIQCNINLEIKKTSIMGVQKFCPTFNCYFHKFFMKFWAKRFGHPVYSI